MSLFSNRTRFSKVVQQEIDVLEKQIMDQERSISINRRRLDSLKSQNRHWYNYEPPFGYIIYDKKNFGDTTLSGAQINSCLIMYNENKAKLTVDFLNAHIGDSE